MLNILVADFYPKPAHRYLNDMLIESLSRYAKVTVVSVNDYFSLERKHFQEKDVDVIDIKVKEKKGKIGTRVYCSKIQQKISKLVKNSDYSICFVLSYDTIAFSRNYHILKKIPIILCEHSNIDELKNRIKRWFYKLYAKKVYHVVWESKFKEYLVNIQKITKENIFVVSHPLTLQANIDSDKKYDCVGLCQANSDEFIKELLSIRDKVAENHLKLLLRSRNMIFNDGNVCVFNDYIERDKYVLYISQGQYSFVATPPSYVYRMSGSIYDAFALYKIVLTTNEFYPKIYRDLYPGICVHINDANELITLLNKGIEYNEEIMSSFEKFREDHSVEKLNETINKMLFFLKEKTNDNHKDAL